MEVDTQVLNDNKLMVRWHSSSESDLVEIRYGWDEDNLDKVINAENDGEHEITGLTNGIHYWFQVRVLKSGCDGEWSVKIDPLP